MSRCGQDVWRSEEDHLLESVEVSSIEVGGCKSDGVRAEALQLERDTERVESFAHEELESIFIINVNRRRVV